MNSFKETIKNIPHKPGVYRYYTIDNVLLYIGKAKDLKNRVSSYFQDGRPKNERLTLMISQIDRIEYTVVASEKESLILEANLIHNLQPKYNVLLKDDKSYVYVRITNDPIPGIFLTRRKYDPKSQYFGPYTRQAGISNALRTLRTIFPYCQEKFQQKRPCSYYGIKQCDGICAGLERKEDYIQKLQQIANVLSGRKEEVEGYLKNKMREAVEIGNFPLAALWRDRFDILNNTIGSQKIILPHPQDLDMVTLVREYNSDGLEVGSVFVQNIRAGKMINVANFLLSGTSSQDNFDEGSTEFTFLHKFLQSYYSMQSDVAPVLIQAWKVDTSDANNNLVKTQLDGQQKEALEEIANVKINLRNVSTLNHKEIGELQELAKQNAHIYLQRNQLGQRLSLFEENNLFVSLVDLKEKLGLRKIPRRIECYDISHLSGKFVYGSMVVFIDGRASKKHYRLFKTTEQNNDFENHKEVLRRRFQRALDESTQISSKVENETLLQSTPTVLEKWTLPDLIIVDGGKGQLSSDLDVLDEFNEKFASQNTCFEVEMCALAKREEEVFLPHNPESVILSGQTKFLIQRIRDEAHRFAITNNRNARLRTIRQSELDNVQGIGPKTKQKLLVTFGSTQNLIDGMYKNPELLYELVGKNITEKLKKHFGI